MSGPIEIQNLKSRGTWQIPSMISQSSQLDGAFVLLASRSSRDRAIAVWRGRLLTIAGHSGTESRADNRDKQGPSLGPPYFNRPLPLTRPSTQTPSPKPTRTRDRLLKPRSTSTSASNVSRNPPLSPTAQWATQHRDNKTNKLQSVMAAKPWLPCKEFPASLTTRRSSRSSRRNSVCAFIASQQSLQTFG